jgi:hypothetical protein
MPQSDLNLPKIVGLQTSWISIQIGSVEWIKPSLKIWCKQLLLTVKVHPFPRNDPSVIGGRRRTIEECFVGSRPLDGEDKHAHIIPTEQFPAHRIDDIVDTGGIQPQQTC